MKKVFLVFVLAYAIAALIYRLAADNVDWEPTEDGMAGAAPIVKNEAEAMERIGDIIDDDVDFYGGKMLSRGQRKKLLGEECYVVIYEDIDPYGNSETRRFAVSPRGEIYERCGRLYAEATDLNDDKIEAADILGDTLYDTPGFDGGVARFDSIVGVNGTSCYLIELETDVGGKKTLKKKYAVSPDGDVYEKQGLMFKEVVA